MSTTIRLGNSRVVEVIRSEDPDGKPIETRVPRGDLGRQVTEVHFPDEMDGRVDLQVGHVRHLWPYHSDMGSPDWVECDDDDLLLQAVSRAFDAQVGRPKDWFGGTDA